MRTLYKICTNEKLDLEVRYAALRQMQQLRKPNTLDNWRKAYKKYRQEERKKYVR